MELRHLRYFIAVAEEENVTRAALRLHLSQPPLSRQMRFLEEELGVALFDRPGKALRLTDAGRIFLEHARALLFQVDRAILATRNQGKSTSSKPLQLGYVPSLTVHLLPQILKLFGQQIPEARVQLHDMTTTAMLPALRAGKLDVALVARHASDRIRPLHFEPLRQYTVGIATARDHAWAGKSSLTLSQVLNEPLVVFSREDYPIHHTWLHSLFGRQTRKLRIVEECDSGPTLRAAVESGRGIAVCSEGHLLPAGTQLAFIPLLPPPPPIEIGIAYKDSALAIPLVRHFIEIARKQAQIPALASLSTLRQASPPKRAKPLSQSKSLSGKKKRRPLASVTVA